MFAKFKRVYSGSYRMGIEKRIFALVKYQNVIKLQFLKKSDVNPANADICI